MITTTLNRIREHSPSPSEYEKLLVGLGKTKANDEVLSFATILEIVGLEDALWYCRVEPQYAREWRLFAVACARRVEHLNTDPRVKNAIDVAERYAYGDATNAELNAAKAAAREVAASYAAWEVAWVAARVAAWAAAWAAKAAARDAAKAAARGAAWKAAAWAAERAAKAARAAEREWQTQEFLRVVTGTEARGD